MTNEAQNETIIRAFAPSDVSALAELELRCFTDPWKESLFLYYLLPVAGGFVAEEYGKIVGYLLYSTSIEEADIENLAVAPEMRNRGIGGKLLRTAVDSLVEKGASALFLEVRVSTAPAIALYHRFGFQDVSVRRNYYQKPAEDGIVMRFDAKNPGEKPD